MKPRLRPWAVAAVAAVYAAAAAADAEAPTAETVKKSVKLLEKVHGDATAFGEYLLDNAAMQVSAAAMVGIAPDAITVAQSTRDVATFVKGFDRKASGIGLAVSPSRLRRPWIPIEMVDYLGRDPLSVLLAGLTVSVAQGINQVDGRDYARRALALSVSGTFLKEDDEIWVMAAALGGGCADKAINDQLSVNPMTATDTPVGGELIVEKQASSALRACIKEARDELQKRWFRSAWTATWATGDVRLDQGGGSSVRLGEALSLAARYGSAWGDSKSKTSQYGWALDAGVRSTRGEPVLSTLGTATLERRDTRLVAVKAAFGSERWRALFERSNARTREAQGGDTTMKRALGVDLWLKEGWWLNLRYGKRLRANGDGEETAGLLSLTISPESLKF